MPEEFMTTPAEDNTAQEPIVIPARLGFVFQTRQSAVDPKENFLNYLTRMNATRTRLRQKQ